MIRSFLLALACLAAMAAPAAARGAAFAGRSQESSEACRYSGEAEGCDPDHDATRLAAYGLEPLSDRGASGASVLRVMFMDDYGRPLPTVVIERLPSGAGRLTVIARYDDTASGPDGYDPWRRGRRVTRVADLTPRATARLLDQAQAVFASPQAGPDDDPHPEPGTKSVCIHPRGAIIQVADRGRTVSRIRLNCYEDPVWTIAYKTGLAAEAALPPCERVGGGWVFYRLQDCLRASADLGAAVAVLAARWSADLDQPDARERFQVLLADDAVLAWQGEPDAKGRDAVVGAWDRLTRRREFYRELWRSEGEASGSVTTREALYARPDGGGWLRAEMTVRWRLENGRRWRIARIDVGKVEVTRPDP